MRKSGKWELIKSAAIAKLTCNHVDRALDLRMTFFEPGDSDVDEFFT